MQDLLEHITWYALSGRHARLAAGTDRACRDAPGFSPIVGSMEVASQC